MYGQPKERPAHVLRLLDETSELLNRVTLLGRFIGGPVYVNLPTEEQRRLTDQRRFMTLYYNVLAERTNEATGEPDMYGYMDVPAEPDALGLPNCTSGGFDPHGDWQALENRRTAVHTVAQIYRGCGNGFTNLDLIREFEAYLNGPTK